MCVLLCLTHYLSSPSLAFRVLEESQYDSDGHTQDKRHLCEGSDQLLSHYVLRCVWMCFCLILKRMTWCPFIKGIEPSALLLPDRDKQGNRESFSGEDQQGLLESHHQWPVLSSIYDGSISENDKLRHIWLLIVVLILNFEEGTRNGWLVEKEKEGWCTFWCTTRIRLIRVTSFPSWGWETRRKEDSYHTLLLSLNLFFSILHHLSRLCVCICHMPCVRIRCILMQGKYALLSHELSHMQEF